MPELPEVETVCRGLRPKLEGQKLVRVIQRRQDLRFPLPEDFAARLEGRTVERIERRAKYMLLHLDDGWTLMGHLGMSGRMTVIEGPPPPSHPPTRTFFLKVAAAGLSVPSALANLILIHKRGGGPVSLFAQHLSEVQLKNIVETPRGGPRGRSRPTTPI